MSERERPVREPVLARIEALQHELEELKQIVVRQARLPKRQTKLGGVWKGVRVADDDFAAAARAVFRDAHTLRT